MTSVLGICIEVSGCCATWLGVSEASCRALLDGLRLNVALVKWTVAGLRGGVILAAG